MHRLSARRDDGAKAFLEMYPETAPRGSSTEDAVKAVLVAIGGLIRTRWDLPSRADGQPFPFDGVMDIFGLLSNPSGSWITVTATAERYRGTITRRKRKGQSRQ